MAKYVQPNFIVDSSASFLRNVTFDSSVYLQGVTHINAPATVTSGTPYALVLETGSGNDLVVKSKILGTMAFETAAAWDASLSAIRTNIDNIESSVGALDLLTQTHTAKLAVHEASIGSLTALTAVHESSIGFLRAYDVIQDASINAVWQRWIDSNRTGFVDNSQTTLSFTSGTPSGSGTFNLNSVGANWSYYRDGIKYTIAGGKSIPLNGGSSAPAGRYYITIEGIDGSLSCSTTPWDLDTQTVLVAYVDWDIANSPNYLIGEERHTMLIDRQMHKYLHETRGTQFVTGGVITGPDVSAGVTSVTNANNTFGMSATEIADEDLFQTLASLTRPNGGTPTYLSFIRASGNLNDWSLEDVPFPVDGGNLQYDDGTNMVPATLGKFVNSYVMFTNLSSSSGAPRYAILPGQGQYDGLEAAIDENPASFDFTGLPVAEYVIAYQLTWEVSSGYSTNGKAALASAPKRISVNATTASAISTESHNDLIGLQGGNATERYHLTQAQWTDYAGKTYVDGSIAALKTYTDSSLGARDTSIAYLNTQRAQLDASIVRIDAYQAIQDASIALKADKTYVDGSLGARDTSIAYLNTQRAQLDASIVRLDLEQDSQDASIVALRTRVSNHDSSIAAFDTLTQNHTTEINNLEASVGALDTLTQSHTALLAVHEASIGFLRSYDIIQDASIALAVSGTTSAWNGLTRTDNSIGLGGTLSQDTVINTSVYQLGVLGSMQISGDLTVDGSITYINTTELDVSDNIIHINTGLTGVPPVNMVSGMRVNRGSSNPYFFIFSETDDTFRIGINASEGGLPAGTQAVATREDAPISTAVPFWNSTANRFDTDSGFTFEAATGLDVDNRITADQLTLQNIPILDSEATALVIATDGSVGFRELGTNAFSSAAFALDSSLAVVRTLVNVHEASIGNIYVELGYADASTTALNALIQTNITDIANLETSVGALDTLTQSHTALLAVHEASLGAIDTSLGQIDTVLSGFGTDITNLETSVGVLDTLTQTHTTQIGNLDSSIDGLDTLTQSHTALLAVHEASLGAIDTSLGQIDTALDGKVSVAGDTMTGTLVFANTGFTLDSVTISTIDTSAEGLGQLDTAIPTSGAVTKAIAAAISAGVTASNGLTENPAGNIKLGGTLSEATTIDISTHSLTLANLVSGTTRLAIISDSGVLKTQQLGTMALEASANYYYASQVDTLVSDLSTLLDNRIDLIDADIAQIEASIVRIDASLNDVIDIFDVIDASLAEIWDAIDDLESSVGGLDTLTQSHTALLAVHEASIGFLRAYDIIQDASIAAAGASVKAWNGLTRVDNSIGLGGSLNAGATVITTNGATASLQIAGLATSVDATPFAIVSDTAGGDLKLRELGSMAWATAIDYTLKSLFDSSVSAIWTEFGHVDTSLANIWTKFGYVDTSMALMNTWNQNQDASIAAISTAQGNYVLKSGDTMTGPLTISAGGLSVANDVSIAGKLLVQQSLTVSNDAYIAGTLTIDGSLLVRDVETIDVSSGFIRLNTGQTGTPPATMQSGIIVERGSKLPYVFVYDETLETFRIGIAPELAGPSFNDASTQAVATREDAPTSFGIAFWNGTAFRFDSSSGFTFTPGVGLGLPIATDMASEATALVWNGTTVGSRELGSNAFTSTAYTPQSLFDSSVAAIWTKFGSVDTSLNSIWTKLGHVDTSLNNLGIKNAAQDSSIAALDLLTQSHTQSITDLSTGKLDAVANINVTGDASIFAYETNNIVYLKKIVAGAGATITQDSSTITIAVSGVSGYVSKHTGTFNGTSGTSLLIEETTHNLGSGPLNVAVYDGTEQVYTGVDCAANGDITLSWSSGSLSASCKYIITG